MGLTYLSYNRAMEFALPCSCCSYYTIENRSCHEQCPVCGWEDGTGSAYMDRGALWLDQAQRNFAEFGACMANMQDAVSPPAANLRRKDPPFTLDAWRVEMASYVAQAREVFGAARRPKHFTNHQHCDECSEHDQELQPYDNDTLNHEAIGHAGWSAVPFLTPEGFRYFMPGLMRVQLEALQPSAAETSASWNLFLLDFRLRDVGNRQFSLFTSDEVRFVAEFYRAAANCPGFSAFFDGRGEIETAVRGWLARAALADV